MNWITKIYILLFLFAFALANGERQRNRRQVSKNGQQRYLTYVNHPTTAALKYSEALNNNKKVFRAVLFYTFDEKIDRNGIEKYELKPEIFEKLISTKEFVRKSEPPQSTSSLISFFDGKCDISINCQRGCVDTTDLCPCTTTTSTPTPSTTEKTTPSTTEKTTPSTTEKTTPSTTEKTTPSTTEKTTPSTTEKTTPSTTERTTPSTTERTTPSTTERTTPSTTEKTTPSTTERTTPSTTERTTPSTTEKTTPSTTEKTTPSTTERTTPSTTERTTPSTTEKTTPSTTEKTTPSTTTTKPTTKTKTYIPLIGITRVPYTRWVGSYRKYSGNYSFGYSWKPFTGGLSWRTRRFSTGTTTTTARYQQDSLENTLNPIRNFE